MRRYKLTDDISLSLAWTHSFRNSIVGDVLQIPGENIKLDAQIDSIVAGLNIQFGAPRKAAGLNSPAVPAIDGSTIRCRPRPPAGCRPPPGASEPRPSRRLPAADDAQLGGKIVSAIPAGPAAEPR